MVSGDNGVGAAATRRSNGHRRPQEFVFWDWPVNELPPDREEAAMNPAERAKIQSELVAARERQASAAAAKDSAAK
jgi:hypothetical protein